MKKWDKTKNVVDPYSIPISYLEKVWWTDSCEHSWKQTIKSYRKYNKQRCPYCAGRKVLKGFNDLETTHPELVKQWSSKNTVSPSDVSHGYDKRIWWECLKGHEWLVSVNSRTFYNSNCPECSAKTFTSKAEKDLLKFINEILENNQIIENTRKVIHPYELDIYIPEKKIAIEFNGLYWHSEENGKDKNYHYDKWKMCNDKDIQLITIWEDNWRKKNNLIKHMLKHKLSVNDSPKEYGRNTYVEEVGYQESSQFLEKYHIQGAASGSKYIALKSIGKSELLAVSVWTKRKKNFVVLERYATSKTVIGGLGKIISYVQKNEYKNKTIITFADHSVSNGEMYFKLGFKKDKEIPPDYSYIVSDKRIHKFNFRKHNFKNNPNLIYNSNLSESELAKINSMLRIWDCGKTRFILEPPNRLS